MMVIPRKREVCVMNNIKSLKALGFIYNFIRGFEGAYSWGACIWGGLITGRLVSGGAYNWDRKCVKATGLSGADIFGHDQFPGL